MNILITICARGGSKGVPGKNIKPIAGKPLLYYTIKTAKQFASKYNAIIGVSTDSDDIKIIAKNEGIIVDYDRPACLATDTAGKVDVIIDIKEYYESKNQLEFEYVLDLDVTSPLRTLHDIEEAFNILKKDPKALNIFSVSPANRNPYFNMVEKKENGYYATIKDNNVFKTRQSAPKVFDINGSFYIYKKIFFDNKLRSAITDKTLIYNINHLCFDIDNLIDFDFMEYLILNNKLDFSF
jgi:CMP-N,N'-diacetyllegionaminic acid synthase